MTTTTITSVFIDKHTTSSTPDPHILYTVEVSLADGTKYEVLRRYSQFASLHASLGDPYTLPPKKSVVNAIVRSAWVNDSLIAERKDGLLAYLNALLRSSQFQGSSSLLSFLSPAFVSPIDAYDDVITPSMICKANLTLLPPSQPKAAAPIAAAYYPDWCAGSLSPYSIDFSKFDVLFFAFVVPNSASTINWDEGSQDTLRQLVAASRQSGHGTKIVLSIGGWGGSYWFSNAMSNANNRFKLVNALAGVVNSFGLDGVDIDWEYPNATGAGNPHSWADSGNFLSFLQTLRSALGWARIISAAVTHNPWLGPNGSPLTNVSDFAAQMTFINIMNYDVNGASSNPGPNAPLGNDCGSSKQPGATAKAALAQWSKAGMPASKMLLGLALYGYASKSTATKLSGSSVPGTHSRPTASCVGGDLNGWWGQQIPFSELVKGGALRKESGAYVASNGYTMGWDDCSDTPYLFNVAKTTVVSYDDTYSLTDKAKFAKQSGMAGCFTWSLDQDDGYTLQTTIRSALGK